MLRRAILASLLVSVSASAMPATYVDPDLPSAADLEELAPTLSPAVLGSGAPRPNIVMILVDDLGYGHLGSYGQRKIRTPNLDAMAAEGARFTAAYSGSTVCAPSRAALMTGRHTGHTTIKTNMGGVRPGGFLLPRDVTIAEVLRASGYTTGVIGKWGMGEPHTPGAPNKKGFDYFYGVTNQVDAHKHYPDYVLKNGERLPIEANRDGRTVVYGDDLYTDEAVKFIDQPRDRPFFLYFAPVAPHAELTVPIDSAAEYEGQFAEKPYINKEYLTDPTKNYADVERPLTNLAGIITRLDRQVGQIIDAVRRSGIADNTLIVFTSDNGPSDEGGASVSFFSGTGPFRGTKRSLNEGGIRVPMIAFWPGKIAPGRTITEPVSSWDLAPTFAYLAGVAMPKSDGQSLMALLDGERSNLGERCLYWRYRYNGQLLQAVRLGDWKLLRGTPSSVELYNLVKDPNESRDLASNYPERVRELDACLRQSEPAAFTELPR